MIYTEFVLKRELAIPQNEMRTVTLKAMLTEAPDMTLNARRDSDGEYRYLNGVQTLTIPASQIKGERYIVNVTDNKGMFYCALVRSPLNYFY